MKIALSLLAVIALVFGWLAMRPMSDGPAQAVVAKALMPAPKPVAVAAPSDPSPAGVRVHGVLYRGPHDKASQALISVAGSPAQVMKLGDAVAQGWSLAEVEPDHVVLSLGDHRARLDVTYSVQAPPAAAAAQPIPVAARQEAAAPGFVAVDSANALPPRVVDTATNRRFLQDRQKRLAAQHN